MDESGQTSAELILLISGIIIIVLSAVILYENYLENFKNEINKTEVNTLINKIDSINSYI